MRKEKLEHRFRVRKLGLLLAVLLPAALFFAIKEFLLWRPRTFHIGRNFSSVRAITFSPDGQRVAALDGSGHAVLWNVSTGQVSLELGRARRYAMVGGVPKPSGLMPAQSQSFGADDNSLATLHSDARVRIWDVVSGKVQRSFRVNDKANVFQQGHFSGNGRLLAVSKASPATHKTRLKWWKSSKRSRPVLRGTVDVYSVETGRLKDTAHGDIGRVVISDDGERLLRIDGAALVLTDRRRKGGNVPYTENVWDVFAASPDGQTVAAEVFPKLQRGTTKRPSPVVLVWNAKIGGLQHTLRTEDDVMQWRSLCYSSEGKLIAAGGFRMPIGATKAESIVQLWDVNTGKLTRTIETEQSSVEDMAFSPDGKTLATGGLTGTLKLWRIRR